MLRRSRHPHGVSASATAEAAVSPWPHADGLISLLETGNTRRSIALEYKRPNEGLHGLLTGMGEVYSYLNKGYNGAVLVVPKTHSSHCRRDRMSGRSSTRYRGVRPLGSFITTPRTPLAQPPSQVACIVLGR